MELNLDSLLTEIRQWLNDPDATIWSQEVLTACLRQALLSLQRVCPQKVTIAGLDGALVSSLPDETSVLLVRMARVLAWETRLMQRSEVFQPEPARQNRIEVLLEQEKICMIKELEDLRLSYLQRSTALPYVIWPEEAQSEEENTE